MSEREVNQRVEVHPGREAIVRFDPERTFTCVDSCTWCCHHGVMLYEPDLYGLAERAALAKTTESVRGTYFATTERKDRETHVDEEGRACVFLDKSGRCELHAEYDWKPTRCSIFPLAISVEQGDIIVEIREDAETHCDGLDETDRKLIDHLDAFLPPVLWELDDPSTAIEV